MKLLFIGDYSNLHACLAGELRREGHTVTVVSDGGRFMATEADRLLSRRPGFFGAVAYLGRLALLAGEWKGYDHVQLINTNFLSLRPGRLKRVFGYLRDRNGAVGLTLAGTDHWYVKGCTEGLFPFSEFRIGCRRAPHSLLRPNVEAEWLSEENARWAGFVASSIDNAVSVLPEYDLAARGVLGNKLHFINLPVDLGSLPFNPSSGTNPVRVFMGIKTGREDVKGSVELLQALKRIESRSKGRIVVEDVRDVSLAHYLERLSACDVMVDQLYGGSPATAALQAMGMGKAVATAVHEDCARFTGHNGPLPLIALDPRNDWEPVLEKALADPLGLHETGVQARKFVEANNASRKVAQEFLKAIGG